MSRCSAVKKIQNELATSQVKLSHQCFIKIALTLHFLAKQGFALGGYNSDNDSNFIQTLKFRAKDILQ